MEGFHDRSHEVTASTWGDRVPGETDLFAAISQHRVGVGEVHRADDFAGFEHPEVDVVDVDCGALGSQQRLVSGCGDGADVLTCGRGHLVLIATCGVVAHEQRVPFARLGRYGIVRLGFVPVPAPGKHIRTRDGPVVDYRMVVTGGGDGRQRFCDGAGVAAAAA